MVSTIPKIIFCDVAGIEIEQIHILVDYQAVYLPEIPTSLPRPTGQFQPIAPCILPFYRLIAAIRLLLATAAGPPVTSTRSVSLRSIETSRSTFVSAHPDDEHDNYNGDESVHWSLFVQIQTDESLMDHSPASKLSVVSRSVGMPRSHRVNWCTIIPAAMLAV
jgi:hypothetical protein